MDEGGEGGERLARRPDRDGAPHGAHGGDNPHDEVDQ